MTRSRRRRGDGPPARRGVHADPATTRRAVRRRCTASTSAARLLRARRQRRDEDASASLRATTADAPDRRRRCRHDDASRRAQRGARRNSTPSCRSNNLVPGPAATSAPATPRPAWWRSSRRACATRTCRRVHVVVDLDGDVVEGTLKPSSDTASHLYIYRHRPDVNGIVHTHSPYATAFAAVGRPIPVYLTARPTSSAARSRAPASR